MPPILRAVLLMTVCVLAACDSGPAATSSVEITDQSTLSIGETAVIDQVSVTFVAVETDSRCPDHAMCVWEGWAFVTLDLDGTQALVRVVDPERFPQEGVRVGDRIVFATALTGTDPEEDSIPQVTVVTAAVD